MNAWLPQASYSYVIMSYKRMTLNYEFTSYAIHDIPQVYLKLNTFAKPANIFQNHDFPKKYWYHRSSNVYMIKILPKQNHKVARLRLQVSFNYFFYFIFSVNPTSTPILIHALPLRLFPLCFNLISPPLSS